MNNKIKTDTASGSISYNRFDMQISQVLHMAIELYDNLNYLFVLDHYDDITLFDDELNPNMVSYYQMKTSNDYIQFNTALKEDWFAKMYKNLERPEWIVRELGLVTNCPIKISIKKEESSSGKAINYKSDSERTGFEKYDTEIIRKIRKDIASKIGISESSVDLSKFVHIRTTLSIERHRDLVEKELGDFLNEKYPGIPIDSVKTIYSTMLQLLTGRQAVEGLKEDSTFDEVKSKKGFSRSEFGKVIERSILISIPPINEVVEYFSEDERFAAFEEYAKITEDRAKQDAILEKLLVLADEAMQTEPIADEEMPEDYIVRIADVVAGKTKVSVIRGKMYIRVLVSMVFINKVRMSL